MAWLTALAPEWLLGDPPDRGHPVAAFGRWARLGFPGWEAAWARLEAMLWP
ncbi:MAG: hypothetical protein R8K47_02630 [Mariprofundaceae bacterium]